jgi:type I restriction enzyme S subunit
MELKPGYKQTEVGVIPEEWEVKPLGSILSRGRLGGNYPNETRETNYPLIKMGNIARSYIDTSRVEYILSGITPDPTDRLHYGDLLFNTRNTLDLVGKVAIWRDELPAAYYNSNLMRLEFDPHEVCSNEYANYALNSKDGVARLRALATGTTSVAAIYTRDLLQTPFIVPPLPEQRAIAQALSDVDALIGALDQLIAKKRDLKQAAMQRLLTGQHRLPAFDRTPQYKKTVVGLIPEDWEVQTLRDICIKIQDGTHFSPSLGGSDYLYVTSKNIGFGTLNIAGADRISSAEHEKIYARCDVKTGDLLLTKDGANTGNAAINTLEEPFSLLSSVAFLRFDRCQHSATFFQYQILSLDGQRRIKLEMSGNAITRLTLRKIKSLCFPVPSTEEQTAIAAVLSDMDAEIAALEARRDKTRALKQGMMQELLTGRIRLV